MVQGKDKLETVFFSQGRIIANGIPLPTYSLDLDQCVAIPMALSPPRFNIFIFVHSIEDRHQDSEIKRSVLHQSLQFLRLFNGWGTLER